MPMGGRGSRNKWVRAPPRVRIPRRMGAPLMRIQLIGTHRAEMAKVTAPPKGTTAASKVPRRQTLPPPHTSTTPSCPHAQCRASRRSPPAPVGVASPPARRAPAPPAAAAPVATHRANRPPRSSDMCEKRGLRTGRTSRRSRSPAAGAGRGEPCAPPPRGVIRTLGRDIRGAAPAFGPAAPVAASPPGFAFGFASAPVGPSPSAEGGAPGPFPPAPPPSPGAGAMAWAFPGGSPPIPPVPLFCRWGGPGPLCHWQAFQASKKSFLDASTSPVSQRLGGVRDRHMAPSCVVANANRVWAEARPRWPLTGPGPPAQTGGKVNGRGGQSLSD